jgi:hypothetical protein
LLETVVRARRGLLRSLAVGPRAGDAPRVEGDDMLCEVDVTGLSSGDRIALVDRLLADSGARCLQLAEARCLQLGAGAHWSTRQE